MRRLSYLAIFLLVVLLALAVPVALRHAFPLHYQEFVQDSAGQHGLDAWLIFAVIQVESNFRPEAVSPKGALGLMQIMPETAAWLGEQRGESIAREQLFDPEINIFLGSEYLVYLLERFETQYAALAAYNAGPTNVRRWLDEGIWDGSYERSGQIPFAETKSYLRKVIMLQHMYQLVF